MNKRAQSRGGIKHILGPYFNNTSAVYESFIQINILFVTILQKYLLLM